MGSGNHLSLPYTDFYMSAGDLYSESQKLRQAPPKKSVLKRVTRSVHLQKNLSSVTLKMLYHTAVD